MLARAERGVPPVPPAYGYLFNSYYEAVGPRQPRPQRGLLSRPPLAEVLRYRAEVDERMAARARGGARRGELLDVVELGHAHEQQHQELLLTDVKHALRLEPAPAGVRAAPPRARAAATGAAARASSPREGGVVEIGTPAGGLRVRQRAAAAPRCCSSRSRSRSRPVTSGE